MTIPTLVSLQGFIATAPTFSFTAEGHPRMSCRVGIDQHRKETDGSSTKLDSVFVDLVLFDRTAERAYARFAVGDQILASGRIHEYESDVPGAPSQIHEQFIGARIGHDCAKTRYVVDRDPTHRPDPPGSDLTVATEPASTLATSTAQTR